MTIRFTLRAAALMTIALTLGTRTVSPGLTPGTQPAVGSGAPAPAAARLKTTNTYGQLPLNFEVNQGQSDDRVEFLARGQGYSLFLTATEAVLRLHPKAGHGFQADAVVRMRLADANPRPHLAGLDVLPGTSNYFMGSDPRQWRRDVPSYARVKYSGVYPGIDLIYYGNQRQLEYDIVVAPHADPRQIALAFDGVETLSLDPDGNLLLHTAHGDIAQHKPVIYQDENGRRQKVDGRYVLRANHAVGFAVDAYDTTEPLVIDPVLSYSTYLGGNGNDVGYAIAVDSAGSAYVTGVTTSTNFPSVNPIQSTAKGSNDVFVTKLNAAGSAVVFSTYLGGSNGEIAYAIAVDGAGNAYVTGETDSGTQTPASIPFPTVGAFDSSYNGGGDAFVTKINASGNALVYSTFLGGGGTERGYGIAVDGAGSAYVTGHTSSDNASSGGPAGGFPTVGALQGNNAFPGTNDAFVTKFNPTGNALVYSTYLGGTGDEFSIDGGAIAVDSDGNAYVGGSTRSTNFPGASTSTIQPAFGGIRDGFVVKMNAAGSALLYSTYLGGTTDDSVNGIAIDGARNAYVVGSTDSSNFRTASPLQAAKGGPGFDAFVSKINAAGSALVYSTYLGGSDGENAYAVAVDATGNAFVSGWTASSNFPTAAPIQAAAAGSGDAFISELNAAGSALIYSTYLGAQSGTEHAYGIALDGAGTAYVTGDTNSTNFPTASPLQATRGGSSDAFVARIIGVGPSMSIDRVSLNFAAVTTGAAFTSQTPPQTVRLIQGPGTGTVTWTAVSTRPWLTVSPASGSGSAALTISTQFAAGLTSSQAGAITLTFTGSANAGSPINVTLTTVPSTSSASPPFGVFDTPAGDATVLAGSIAVTGWTLDNVGVSRVELWRDLVPGETTLPFASTPSDPRNGKVFIAYATFVDNARPDVELLNPTLPFANRAGWGYLLLTWGLWNQGNGTYKFYAFAFDQEDNVATIGAKTVIISNTAATKPFGSIDTPAIGGDASGPNFGWGLTPRVNGAATCKIQASGVQVSIDSGPLQPVVYGDARTDIAGYFPGFSNTAAAGGHYIIDWSTLTTGTHTIGWLLTDDCNRADGVGSRYFNVRAGTSLVAADTQPEIPSRLAAVNHAALAESDAPITVARGYGELPLVVDPGLAGSRTIEVQLGERVELRLPHGFETAYQLGPNGQQRPLPTGSTWDAGSGIFYWHPAPGFFGRYRIVFSDGRQKISVRVVIVP